MKIHIVTLHPGFFESPLQSSILGRGIRSGALSVTLWNLRDFARDKHQTTDLPPAGGGPGLVLKPEPIAAAFRRIGKTANQHNIFLSPQGTHLTDAVVRRLAGYDSLTMLCGHYEGVDQRVLDTVIDEDISVGDYVLSGGEPAALILLDAVARMIPGVLGNQASAHHDSFSDGLLEGPQYTKPRVWMGKAVPDVLLEGNHKLIEAWRHERKLAVTGERRPDLLDEFLKREAQKQADKPKRKPKRSGAETISSTTAPAEPAPHGKVSP